MDENKQAVQGKKGKPGKEKQKTQASDGKRWRRHTVSPDVLQIFEEERHRQILKRQSPRQRGRKRRFKGNNKHFFDTWG